MPKKKKRNSSNQSQNHWGKATTFLSMHNHLFARILKQPQGCLGNICTKHHKDNQNDDPKYQYYYFIIILLKISTTYYYTLYINHYICVTHSYVGPFLFSVRSRRPSINSFTSSYFRFTLHAYIKIKNTNLHDIEHRGIEIYIQHPDIQNKYMK